jgi:hypothetical protein
MKNKPQFMDQRSQTKILDWLCLGEEQDDFLMGKTPIEFSDSWEEEE